jgi:hypothetical protein
MILLSRQEIAKSIRQGYLTATADWAGGFVSLFSCLCLCFFSIVFVWGDISAQFLPIALLSFLGLSVLSIYAVWRLITGRKLVLVETRLNAATNKQLMAGVFNQLKWPISQNKRQLIEAQITKRWFEVPSYAIVLITDNKVYLNVASYSTSRGRFPSFGSNSKNLVLLTDAVNQATLTF